jgi:hypothetical protein
VFIDAIGAAVNLGHTQEKKIRKTLVEPCHAVRFWRRKEVPARLTSGRYPRHSDVMSRV